ncbi:MAG: GWxTD domain-containing protein [Gemmatimonadetes bacterium]|nr:GWxTD domain-containing protein [Gemmatimonadota bacterium]
MRREIRSRGRSSTIGPPPDSLPGWLRGFWGKRELADGRPAGTRLPEHFRRVRYAHANFAYRGMVAQYQFEQVYRKAAPDLDDRGMVYIRQGEPDRRANYVGSMGTPPNESWLYFRPTGDLILHFAELRTAGWRLVESLADIGGNSGEMYESRGGLDPTYLALAAEFEMRASQIRAHVLEPRVVNPLHLVRDHERGRRMIAVTTTTDADPIDLDRSWKPVAQVYGLGAPAPGTAGLLTVVALPLPADLAPVPLPGGAAGYVIRLRITAADDSGRTTLDVDSLVRLRTPRPLAKGEFLTVVRAYPLAAGNERVRLILADSAGDHGAVLVFSGVPAVDLTTSKLVVSDLIVGREGSGASWTAPSGTTIPLQPLNAWGPSEAVAVSFEVSGLAAGRSYRIRIGLGDIGADSAAPPKASVEFEAVASGAREWVSQTLSLKGVRPGRYLMTVTVTDGDRSDRRERRITVTAP